MAMSAEKVLARRYGLSVADVTLATAMTGKQAAQFLGVSKKVGDAIAGSDALDLTIVFDALASGYADGFDVTWERADKPKLRTNTIAAGATATVTPVPTGTSCQVVSVVPEAPAPPDWHWGDTTIDPADGEVKIVEGTNAKVTITPTIVMDAEG